MNEPASYFLGPPAATAMLRATPDDFEVSEVLGFEPDGVGDHALLLIQKRNTNTEWLARQLAKFSAVKSVDVGYGGLKDRNAVTSQWFSVNLSGKSEPDWVQLESADIRVLRATRNRRKLKRGAHHANRFVITLRELRGDRVELESRLQAILTHGVPNYFGEQRFGIDANNVDRARALFANEIQISDRHQRGLYLSAARAYLFNAVLARRVADASWNQALDGEAFILDGTHSFFVSDQLDEVLHARVLAQDIHPSGPLWGRGALATYGATRQLEQDVLSEHTLLCRGLETAGLEQARRALRLRIGELRWEFVAADALRLDFVLPSGCYATTVLRELIGDPKNGS